MNRRRFLAPSIVLAALVLTGCASFPNAEQAYQECQDKITPQFDDPTAVSWPDSGDTYSGQGDDRMIAVVVDNGGTREEVSCWVTQTDNGWELSRYDIGEPIDEVVK